MAAVRSMQISLGLPDPREQSSFPGAGSHQPCQATQGYTSHDQVADYASTTASNGSVMG